MSKYYTYKNIIISDYITEPDVIVEKPSVIGVQKDTEFEDAKEIIDLNRRKSTCVAGYKVNLEKVKELVKNVNHSTITGVSEGRKHIYHVGDFMRSHCDTKSCVKHIYTLLFIENGEYTGGAFKITDDYYAKTVPTVSNVCDGKSTVVLFPPNMMHEVTDVISGVRVSYSFKVYGNIDYSKFIEFNKPYYDVYDNVYEALYEITKELIEEKGELDENYFSRMKACQNSSILNLLMPLCGVTFYDKSWQHYDEDTSEPLIVKQMVTVVYQDDETEVFNVDELPTVFKKLVKGCNVESRDMCVLKLVLNWLKTHSDDIKSDYQRKLQRFEQDSKFKETVINFVQEHKNDTFYIIKLFGKYYKSTTVEELISVDRFINDTITKSKFKTSIVIGKIDYNYKYEKNTFDITQGMMCRYDVNSGVVGDISAEFNDEGAYDPSFRTYESYLICYV